MLLLDDCLTSDTRIVLMKPEEKKKFSFFKSKEKKIYRKDFNHAEFVGEGLCDIRNLDCARCFLIGEGYFNVNRVAKYGEMYPNEYQLKLGSYDFKKPEFEYFDLLDFPVDRVHYPNTLSQILSMAPNEKNRSELLDEIEEMFALDFYMAQTDRIPSNIMFQVNPSTREIHLAPIYDFEYSLTSRFVDYIDYYDNALYSMYNERRVREFIKEHPEFADKLAFYLDVHLADVVRWSYGSKGLKVPEDKYPFYQDFDQKRKQLIRTVLNK